ncbi:MAG: GntR family transcriptional regulator [Chloroflexi bacterium]|nr:MAG: GntR family transcriptional regulator [Chloroflexota bacterium]
MDDVKSITLAELDIQPVDPDSPVPLYYQIENDLRRLMREGKLPPNSLIPPELELCRAYGVGRHTMRAALARLAADNLITRRAGRGTVVNPRPDRSRFYLDRSFTRLMAEMGRVAYSQVLEQKLEVIGPDCPEVFRDKIGQTCLRLVRLRFGDEEPVGLQASTVLVELCPGLEKFDFNQHSLYDLLSSEYHLAITRIEHTISAAVADHFQASMLGISEGDPLLVVKTAAYLDSGQVIEYTLSHYRADRYEYSTSHVYPA